ESNVAPNEPEHWLHFTFCGSSMTTVAISTTDKKLWKKMLVEVSKGRKKISFDDGTSDIAYRYIGKTYTFESYEPKNGLNLALNSLYQIYAFKSDKK
ncbi:MAG: hypothetical protein HY842_05165, partial [Bacteroidetes bacterium]|nr:hypothetical protein [Bacteroidota bacterium]